MKNYLLTALSLLLMTTITQAGHHEAEEAKAETIIGTVFSDDGTANPLVAGGARATTDLGGLHSGP